MPRKRAARWTTSQPSFAIAERLFDVAPLWEEIDAARISEQARLALYRLVAARDELAHWRHSSLDTRKMSASTPRSPSLRPAIGALRAKVDTLIQPEQQRRVALLATELAELGVPKSLAGARADAGQA